MVFTSIIKNKKNNSIECEANQIRLGGYKKDEKVSDVFAASDYIKVIYSVNNNNDFIGYEAKNGPIKIIIEEIILFILLLLLYQLTLNYLPWV